MYSALLMQCCPNHDRSSVRSQKRNSSHICTEASEKQHSVKWATYLTTSAVTVPLGWVAQLCHQYSFQSNPDKVSYVESSHSTRWYINFHQNCIAFRRNLTQFERHYYHYSWCNHRKQRVLKCTLISLFNLNLSNGTVNHNIKILSTMNQ